MNLRIAFKKVKHRFNFLTKKYEPVFSYISPSDLLYFKLLVDGDLVIDKGVNLADYLQNGVVTLNIPTIDIEEEHLVTVAAVFGEGMNSDFNSDFSKDFSAFGLSDWNNDFNQDFGAIGIRRAYTYTNTFKTFGYDLGNNHTTNNPDFTILFASNKLIDWSADYSADFYAQTVFAHQISYRKPFTDQVLLFDASSAEAITQWSDDNGVFSTDRNALYHCQDVTKLSFKKLLPTYKDCDKVVLEDSTVAFVIPKNPKTLPDCPNTVVSTNRQNLINKDTKNQLHTFIRYDLDQYWKNDQLVYPYKQDFLERKVVDFGSRVILRNEQVITDFNAYNPFQTVPEFQVLEVGDHIVKTKLQSYNYSGKLLKLCEIPQKIFAELSVMVEVFEQGFRVLNNGFSSATVSITQVLEKNTKIINSITIQPLDNVYIQLMDGVYIFESGTYIQVKIIDCGLRGCLIKAGLDYLENVPLQPNKSYHVDQQMNALMTAASLYYKKLAEYDNVYLFRSFQELHLADWFSITHLINVIHEYCSCSKPVNHC